MAAIPGELISIDAAVDLSASVYRMFALDANGNAVLPAGQGVQCHGIIEEPNVSGRVIGGRVIGTSKIELGEVMAAGAPFTAFDATGRAGVAIAADHVQGYLLQGGAAGAIVPCVVAYAGIF